MSRFDEQPAITSDAWSFFLRFVAWMIVALGAQELGNSTESLVLAGLCGLVTGLSLVIIAWNFERGDDDQEWSRNGRLGKYLNNLIFIFVSGVLLWTAYRQITDGIDKNTVFLWGYFIGLASVALASSRGYLKPRSNT
ncbi:MAG: hypothetical protein GXC70_04425 [Sphingomonadaceae bacterium]|nr:hypothetical protein [Sphingomonadaceae bacterium]